MRKGLGKPSPSAPKWWRGHDEPSRAWPRRLARTAWLEAHESLTQADRAEHLSPQHVERLARSAYMLGRDDDYASSLERAFRAYLDAGDIPSAARCTWWIGHGFVFRGELARGLPRLVDA